MYNVDNPTSYMIAACFLYIPPFINLPIWAYSSSLNAWMDYIDAVTAIDPTTAPDINWPELSV